MLASYWLHSNGDISNRKPLIIAVQHSPVVTKGKLLWAENVSLAKQQTDSYEQREHLRQELILPLSSIHHDVDWNFQPLRQVSTLWNLTPLGASYSPSHNSLTPIRV